MRRMRCRDCVHRSHGYACCPVRRCKCWPPIELSRTVSRKTGRLISVGRIRIDLLRPGYIGGYYELLAPGGGDPVSWGSLATLIGGSVDWRKVFES